MPGRKETDIGAIGRTVEDADPLRVSDVCAFYDDLLVQVAQNDRLLLADILNDPACTSEMRQACERWAIVTEALGQVAIENKFRPQAAGVKLL